MLKPGQTTTRVRSENCFIFKWKYPHIYCGFRSEKFHLSWGYWPTLYNYFNMFSCSSAWHIWCFWNLEMLWQSHGVIRLQRLLHFINTSFSLNQVIPFPMSCDIWDECSCRDPNAIENRKDEHVHSLGWPTWAGTSVQRPRTLCSNTTQPEWPRQTPPSSFSRPPISCTCCLTGIPLHPYCNPDQLKCLRLHNHRKI